MNAIFSLSLFLPGMANAACVVTGCNGQICASEAQESFGQCDMTLNSQCYAQFGICEEDQNGQCNWRQTQGLNDCLNNIQQISTPSVTAGDPAPRSLPNNAVPCNPVPGYINSCNNKPYVPNQTPPAIIMNQPPCTAIQGTNNSCNNKPFNPFSPNN